MKRKSTLSRQIILEILLEAEKGNFIHVLIKSALDKYSYLSDEERTFIKRMSVGCIERRLTLDYIIDQFSKTPVRKCKAVIANILRMGVYQMYYMDSVSDFAAVDEAVKLCMDKGFYNLKGFVNGVLRNISRAEKITEFPDMSIKYSMPEEIIDILKDSQIREEELYKVLGAGLEVPLLYVRVNTSRISVDACIKMLESEGVSVLISDYFDFGLIIEKKGGVESLKTFLDGYITVQDLSSMFVGECARISDGMKVLDLCAAPGGKTFHIADRLKGTGSVISCDISDEKTEFIKDGLRRQGFDNAEVMVRDALSDEDGFADESFDLIIADLPCSGLGVMGRKTDIKYRVTKDDVNCLAALQRQILAKNIRYLKKGGQLIFSTCTITKSENLENYKYIRDELGLKPEPIKINGAVDSDFDTAKDGYIQLIQGVNRTDGFFVSSFLK